MTRFLICTLLAAMALSAEPPPPLFSFAADSLTATVTRIGGKAPDQTDSLLRALPCDSAADTVASGPVAWFEVEVNDTRAGTDVRFPVDERALRRGLRIVCQEKGAPSPVHVATVLRAMASKMRVRMRPPSAGSGK
ncbi:MAG: hypothetical protein JF616_16345 [Fibrobacteres bacterium]|nr:hypothetical protein [Fibrobacterota bacterium]